jgi:hypothetical protein
MIRVTYLTTYGKIFLLSALNPAARISFRGGYADKTRHQFVAEGKGEACSGSRANWPRDFGSGGAPEEKIVQTFQAIDRPHFGGKEALVAAAAITPEICPVPETGPITGPKTAESSPEFPSNAKYCRCKPFETVQAGKY